MTKRILKRHKRQVARAKARVKLSEPDVRTPEQVRAAREASGLVGRNDSRPHYAARPALRGPAAVRERLGETDV